VGQRVVIATKRTPDDDKLTLERKVWILNPNVFKHYYTSECIGDRDGAGYAIGRGTAYEAKRGDGPRLDGNLQLAPTFYRVESPFGVRWLRADSLSETVLAGIVCDAYEQWRNLGTPKVWREVLQLFRRDGYGGLMHVEGHTEHRLVSQNIVDQALALFRSGLAAAKGGKHHAAF